jgi:SAM-dependent methyltransferase
VIVRDQYAALAPLYDAMARDPGIQALYTRWREALLETARARGLDIRVLVDLACGIGNSTVPWTRHRNWTIAGVDVSAAMLAVARRKSSRVRWYRQDLTRLRLRERADAVTCQFDALNHILDAGDLERVFRNAAAILRPDGLFQFDLNTVEWLRWLHDRDKFFPVGRHAFTTVNTFDRASGVATFRQVWFVRTGGRYERRDVAVRERAYTDRFLRGALRRGGFRLLSVSPQVTIDRQVMRKVYQAVRARD